MAIVTKSDGITECCEMNIHEHWEFCINYITLTIILEMIVAQRILLCKNSKDSESGNYVRDETDLSARN